MQDLVHAGQFIGVMARRQAGSARADDLPAHDDARGEANQHPSNRASGRPASGPAIAYLCSLPSPSYWSDEKLEHMGLEKLEGKKREERRACENVVSVAGCNFSPHIRSQPICLVLVP